MKRFFFKSLLLGLPFTLMAQQAEDPNDGSPFDQVEFCLGGIYIGICKAMTMAKEAGYPFVKLVSYDLIFEQERLSYSSKQDFPDGELITFEDEEGKITVACFDQDPEGVFGIEIAQYNDLLEGFRILDVDDDDEE